jgi:hypothetical protein
MTSFEMAKLLVPLGRIADSLEHLADKATGAEVDAVELVEQRQLREASRPHEQFFRASLN